VLLEKPSSFFLLSTIMTSRKGKRKTIPKGDFNFRFETGATRKRSPAIRIESRSERDNAQTSSPGKRDENVP
jgi:hypothetical protein